MTHVDPSRLLERFERGESIDDQEWARARPAILADEQLRARYDAALEADRERRGDDSFRDQSARMKSSVMDAIGDEAEAAESPILLRRGPMIVLALAAAILLVWIIVPRAATLPIFTIEVTGGEASTLGTAPKTAVLTDGTAIEFYLRPDVPTDLAVQAVVFIESADTAKKIALSFERSEEGVLIFVGPLPLDGLGAGAKQLVSFVGTEDSLAGVRPDRPTPDGVQRFEWSFRYQP